MDAAQVSLVIDVADCPDSAVSASGSGLPSLLIEEEEQRGEPLRGPGSGSGNAGQKFGKRGLLSEFLEPEADLNPLASIAPTGTATTAAGSSQSSSSFFNGAFSMLSPLDAPSSPIVSPTHSQPAASSSSSSSFGLLSSMFSGTTSSSASKSKDAGSRRPELHADEEDSGRFPSAMRLTCLRCSGSVEGPKFSTCKCKVPALNPQDLQQHGSTGGRLQGLMYSSVTGGMTSVAGGVLSGSSYLAGGLMKASSQSMVGLFSTQSATATEQIPVPGSGLGSADNDSHSIIHHENNVQGEAVSLQKSMANDD